MSDFIDRSPEKMVFVPLSRLVIKFASAEYDHPVGRKPIILLNPDDRALVDEKELPYSFIFLKFR